MKGLRLSPGTIEARGVVTAATPELLRNCVRLIMLLRKIQPSPFPPLMPRPIWAVTFKPKQQRIGLFLQNSWHQGAGESWNCKAPPRFAEEWETLRCGRAAAVFNPQNGPKPSVVIGSRWALISQTPANRHSRLLKGASPVKVARPAY